MIIANLGAPSIANESRMRKSKRRRIYFAIGICTMLVLLSAMAYLWVKDEMLTVDVQYHDQSRVAVYVDGRTLAFENLSQPNTSPALFSRSTSVAKGTYTVKVVEEISGTIGIVTVDVYGTLYVIAYIGDGRIDFQVTSTRPSYQ